MKIRSVEFKNFASYGNRVQRIDFEEDKGELYLVTGNNGAGKCLSPDTQIQVEIDDPVVRSEFILFLEERNKSISA